MQAKLCRLQLNPKIAPACTNDAHGWSWGMEYKAQTLLLIYLLAFPWFATLCILAAIASGSPKYSL